MDTKLTGKTRIESDLIGAREIPAEALYGVQTLRGIENFSISKFRLSEYPLFIKGLAITKMAAAMANFELGLLTVEQKDAIIAACGEILDGKHHDQFPVDMIQGGAGTTTNMNANEVIANRALELMGHERGEYQYCSPNDHVNCSQSTNDAYPTAIHIGMYFKHLQLLPHLEELIASFRKKGEEFSQIIKMGRTQMQDAVPIRLGQEFKAYSVAIMRDIHRMDKAMDEMRTLNMGGTAIGTGINADEGYLRRIVPNLTEISGMDFIQAFDLIDSTQNLDPFVAVSGAVKACAVTLSKMSNDLRLMSSGPRCGFQEINLPAKQNGSSIMPGKVNPVIPEVMSQAAFCIMGNDVCITMAAEAGQLELNYAEPVLYHKLFESINALAGAVETFVDNCVSGITANAERCQALVDGSVGIITAICPQVGYQFAADIAKKAIKTGQSVRELLHESGKFTDEEINKILDPHSMV